MASALSASSCSTCVASSSRRSFLLPDSASYGKRQQSLHFFRAGASSAENDTDCNTEECAPDKEVGKISMEWRAGDNTKVAGTFPPRTRGYTGYVEKDTAGQTNIYSVEPSVYVSESVISSGSAGSSGDGAQNTAAIAAGIALICVAGASSILLQVGKKNPPPQIQPVDYSGASLSYYINKFKPVNIVEASAPIVSTVTTTPTPTPSLETESPTLEASQVSAEPESLQESTTPNVQESEASNPIPSSD